MRTDEQGGFSFPELPPAVYRVKVEHAGYGPFVARIELAMNQEVWVRVPLQIGTRHPGGRRERTVHPGRSRYAGLAHLYR